MSKSDGSVIIDTRILTNGMKSGVADIKSQFSDMASSARQAAEQIESAMTKGISKYVNRAVTDNIAKAKAELDYAAKEFAKINSEYQDKMTVTKSLETQLNNARRVIENAGVEYTAPDVYLEAYLKENELAPLVAKQRASLDSLEKVWKSAKEKMENAERKLSETVQTEARKQAVAKERAAEKSAKAAETAAKRQAAAEEKAARNQARYADSVSESTKNTSKLGKETVRFGRRLSSIVSGALFFNIISSGLSSLTRTVWDAISGTQQMKNALNNLKGAASVAAAPLVNELANAFAILTNKIAEGFTWLARFYSLLTGKSISSMKQQAQQMNNMASGAAKAQKALAGFDEITVLQDKSSGSGGGSSTPNYDYGLNDAEIDESVIKSVEKFRKVLDPLQKFDYSKLTKSTEELEKAQKKLADTIVKNLGDAYDEVLVPLAEWTVEDLAPASVDLLTNALDLLTASSDTAVDSILAFNEETKPAWEYLGDFATDIINNLGSAFGGFAETVKNRKDDIVKAFEDIGFVFGDLYSKIEPALLLIKNLFNTTMLGISEAADIELNKVIDAFTNLATFIRQVYSGDWAAALETIKESFKDWLVGSIEAMNAILLATAVGLNKLLMEIRKITFTIPDWVPFVGGKTYRIETKPINPASWQISIPQLASGAVIPPNAPFLAMLGDQRHGTNIEAPLSTIQEAFRAEVGEMVGGMMAGFQASLEVQEQILSAILGIEIGDTTIGEAAARYSATQRIIRGG